MSVLKKFTHTARIEGLFSCSDSTRSIVSEPVTEAMLEFEGIEGDCHSGINRAACTRFQELYEPGVSISNSRQLTIVSVEELTEIATDLSLDTLPPTWLGANISLSGIPSLTLLPPSSRLKFPSGAVVVVDLENKPCVYPAKIIESFHPGQGKRFIAAANQRRGFTARVERPGMIGIGDQVEVYIPSQLPYPQ